MTGRRLCTELSTGVGDSGCQEESWGVIEKKSKDLSDLFWIGVGFFNGTAQRFIHRHEESGFAGVDSLLDRLVPCIV